MPSSWASLPPAFKNIAFSDIHVVGGVTHTGGAVRLSACIASDPLMLSLDNVYSDTASGRDPRIGNGDRGFSSAYANIAVDSSSTSFSCPDNTGLSSLSASAGAASDVSMRRIAPGALPELQISHLQRADTNFAGRSTHTDKCRRC